MATRTISRLLTLLILSSICSGIVAGTDARNTGLDFVNPPESGEVISLEIKSRDKSDEISTQLQPTDNDMMAA